MAALLPLLLGSAIGYARTQKQEEAAEAERMERERLAAAEAERRAGEMARFENIFGNLPGVQPTGMPASGGAPPTGNTVPGPAVSGPGVMPGKSIMSPNSMGTGNILSQNMPLYKATAESISQISDSDERARAWRDFYTKLYDTVGTAGKADLKQQQEMAAVDQWKNGVLRMNPDDIKDPYQKRRVESLQELLNAGADPALLYAQADKVTKKAFEQSGEELAAEGDFGRTKEQLKMEHGMDKEARKLQDTLDRRTKEYMERVKSGIGAYEKMQDKQAEDKAT